MKKRPFTFIIHIALAIILTGAIVTHYCGIQGEVTLYDGAAPVCSFEKSSGPGQGDFPFDVQLQNADIIFYPGTTTPMDFKSTLLIGGHTVEVSMNKVGEIDGWRFYQSGISPDSTTLAVSHDPWGTGITYIGYILLGVGMAGFFFQRKTPWHTLLRHKSAVVLVALFAACSLQVKADNELPAMQRPLAANFGKVYVYWNDRVCPMQTMARDVTAKLYGGESYKGLTAEQVLSGWLFYFDTWQRDFMHTHPDAIQFEGESLKERVDKGTKDERKLTEQLALIQWLGTGEAFKIYPYHSAAGTMEWLSLTGRRPSQMSLEQWKFMQTMMPRMKELLFKGKNVRCNELIDTLIARQIHYAGVNCLPSPAKMQAERIYNIYARPAIAGIVALLLAIMYLYVALHRGQPSYRISNGLYVGVCILLAYMLAMMSTQWWIGNHLPLSNGPETMLFMALVAIIGSMLPRCGNITRGSLVAVAAMALFVAAMAGRTPRIGALMPVLASPLLSVHVMLVMTSYALFMLMAILSAVALSSSVDARKKQLCRTNRLILTPAVCLLAAGIFVGAVWANQSWGRYWGWDPKETCALVMLLVYSLPVHWGTRPLAMFRKPVVLHRYLLLAIITVLFTYFGANYLLPGLHSYA